MDLGYPSFEGSEVYAATHLGLFDDPYKEDEELVCRGVSMAVGTVSPRTDHTWQSFAFGLGEVLDRSAGTDVPMKPKDFTCEFADPFDRFPSESKPLVTCGVSRSEVPLADRFALKDLPPPLPTDSFFQLESTSLRVSAEPYHLGNVVLDFFFVVLDCIDLKTDCRKFSVKATVFYKNSTLSVKLRVYEVMQGSYVVEFQRRRGDCVVFMDLFHELVDHLGSNQHCSLVASSAPVVDVALEPPVSDTFEGEDLSPLIDIIEHRQTQPVEVLEDVATALMRMAQNGRTAPLLCTYSASRALAALVQVSLECLSLLAARTLYALIQHQESKQLFAHDWLIEAIRDKLCATPLSTTTLRHELVRVLQAVAAELPQKNCTTIGA
eukprot:CAMPEP_0115219156 /NCGR_PEP_ID=MMETSP0270-20121206/26767_1 /TAXON_ID=71861 /ORGANISM="Scrippsiella trochoidea, Strain CCMP3099" /LENGTH=379 /DNA_ID=CAMNT_0002633133 /DNA_START=120 /DNA_END=1259 /DNA_ORIENTATION=-